VALPMDEQRILEEMERMLAADDPRLAARLSAFGQPGVGAVFRTRRAKALLSLVMVAAIATAASVIYMMSVFRPGGSLQNSPHRHPSAQLTKTLGADKSMPFSGPAHCMVRIAPRTCVQWSAAKH
jgi:hypothetical protein